MSNDQPKMEIAGFLLKRNGQTDFVLVMFFVILVLNVTSLRHKSFTTDEPFHFEYGLKILLTDSDRFDDSKMPVSALNALVVLGELDADDPNMNLDAGKIQRARLVTVFCSLVLALLIYCWARKLYGLCGAMLSLTTYAFAPNILAHSRLNMTDLYAALSLTLVLYTFWRFRAKENLKWGSACALSLGFAQIAKFSSVFLFPILGAVVLIQNWKALHHSYAEKYWPAAGQMVVRFAAWASVFVGATIHLPNNLTHPSRS